MIVEESAPGKLIRSRRRSVLVTERFGFEDITGLPWIEIDCPADLERARIEILPRAMPS